MWRAFSQIQTSASIPRGAVIGCKIIDPRLELAFIHLQAYATSLTHHSFSFPPKNSKVLYDKGDEEDAPSMPLSQPNLQTIFWPTAKLASSDVWDESTREKVSQPKYKKKDIDERKSKVYFDWIILEMTAVLTHA
jgi:ribonuclease P/MRP protein subunit POP1